MPTPDHPHSCSAPPADDTPRQLATLREELRVAVRGCKGELRGLLDLLGRDAAGLALLPLRLVLGLPLAVGTLWGLWRALALVFG